MKIFFVLTLPVLAGFTACRIRLQLCCINTLMSLILILQILKQMDKFHNPFSANILLLWKYRQLLQLNNVLTENRQIFCSKLKYITISGYVKLKTLHQPCYCKITKNNVSWIIHAVKNWTINSCVLYNYRPYITKQSPESYRCLKKTTWKVVFCKRISENLVISVQLIAVTVCDQ